MRRDSRLFCREKSAGNKSFSFEAFEKFWRKLRLKSCQVHVDMAICILLGWIQVSKRGYRSVCRFTVSSRNVEFCIYCSKKLIIFFKSWKSYRSKHRMIVKTDVIIWLAMKVKKLQFESWNIRYCNYAISQCSEENFRTDRRLFYMRKQVENAEKYNYLT